MTAIDTIRTDTWRISIPHDWIENGQSDEGALYFEASDGRKGIYITTWHVAETDARTSEQIADSFKPIDLRSLLDLERYSWRTVAEYAEHPIRSIAVTTDFFAEAKCYRLVGRILARSPVVVRATFHDYDCSQYSESLAWFSPIIQSLQFNDGAD